MAHQTRARIIFFGSPEFAAVSLRALASDPRLHIRLVITNPDKPAGRGKKLVSTPVKLLAEQLSIPVITPEKITKILDSFIADVSQYGPFDIGVVVAFGQILPLKVLSLPNCGSLNVHGSLLPRWRGAAPMQRAIMTGDLETGVELMQMEEGLDTGPVFATKKVTITDQTTLGSLHDELAVLGASLLTENILKIINKEITSTPQTEAGVLYAKKILNDEAHIQWNSPVTSIIRHIHGISPFPGAFTFHEGKRIKIFRVEKRVSNSTNKNYSPGTLTLVDGNELRIACQDGEIALLELQAEGKKRLPTREFLSGVTMKPGDKLG